MKIEMRWVHCRGAIGFTDFNKDTVVLIQHASDTNHPLPLKLQYRMCSEVFDEIFGGGRTSPWVDVAIVKEEM